MSADVWRVLADQFGAIGKVRLRHASNGNLVHWWCVSDLWQSADTRRFEEIAESAGRLLEGDPEAPLEDWYRLLANEYPHAITVTRESGCTNHHYDGTEEPGFILNWDMENAVAMSQQLAMKLASTTPPAQSKGVAPPVRRKKAKGDPEVLYSTLMAWHKFGDDKQKLRPASAEDLLSLGLEKLGWKKHDVSRAFKSAFGSMKRYKTAFVDPSRVVTSLHDAAADKNIRRMLAEDLLQ